MSFFAERYSAPLPAAPLTAKASGITRFGLVILFVYVCTSQFYVFGSGRPQPSHILLFFGVILVLSVRFLEGRMRLGRPEYAALAFGGLTFTINIIHYAFMPDRVFLQSSLFYVFDAFLFVFIMVLLREAPQAATRLIYSGLVVSLITEILHVLMFSEIGRAYGTFNNPNQLSYWSLFSACLLLLLRSYTKLRWYDLALFFGVGLLQTAALSKAGLITFCILVVTLPFTRMMPVKYKATFFLLAAFTSLFVVFSFANFYSTITGVQNISNAINRIDRIGYEQDDSLEGRGYLRPVEYWDNLFLGAGEGGYSRFTDIGLPLEIHSGLINILFSYGFIGFGVFLFFLFQVVKRSPRYFLVILMVIMIHGLVHQNIRFTYFWIVMALACGIRYTKTEYTEEPQAAYPLPENRPHV
ncbi:MAG: hypothetical protein LRY54_02565 [Alphaproteobacteria bacterium]|nr:hypothetical protein [Alphaproteobacteria bacterium]